MNGDGISYGSWGQNVALINVAKAFGFNPKYMEDESHANILSRKYNLTFLSFLKNMYQVLKILLSLIRELELLTDHVGTLIIHL